VQNTQTDLHEPDVLTVAEVAAALRFTPATIYEKVKAGEIAVVRISDGRQARIRVPRSELERLLRPQAKLSAASFPADAPSARGHAESTLAAPRGTTNGTQSKGE
jgi:excisionase family DNA binding protein